LASIRPFRGTRFNPGSFNDLAPVIAPPYDVISDAMRDVLIGQSQHNIVQIDFGAEQSGDGASSNRYTRAAALFREWRADEVLVDDPSPTLTIYAQDYALPDGRAITRAGIFAAVELMALGPKGVMPHERTFDGPKADRLNLTRATNANFSAIFALYADPEERVNALIAEQMKSSPPTMKGRTGDGILHRAWVVDDPAFIEGVRSALADKALYIADGHHRYETALAYGREHPETPGAAQVMVTLVNMSSPGLVVLATHRLLSDLPGFAPEQLLERASRRFEIRRLASDDALRQALDAAPQAGAAIGLVLAGDEGRYLLSPKPDALEDLLAGLSETERRLDVVLLHKALMAEAAGLSDDDVRELKSIRYVRGFEQAIADVASGAAQAAFLLRPVDVQDVARISFSGGVMPQKSTDFHPKLLSGFTTYRFGPPTAR
jgi:uncharacterized protein (DUF1015 family)